MRTALFLLASLVASLVLGTLAAYVAVEILPCHWFGTAFEGACAYGVLWTSIGIGLGVMLLSFAYACVRLWRRRAGLSAETKLPAGASAGVGSESNRKP